MFKRMSLSLVLGIALLSLVISYTSCSKSPTEPSRSGAGFVSSLGYFVEEGYGGTCNCLATPTPPRKKCEPCNCNAAEPTAPSTPGTRIGEKTKTESQGICKGDAEACKKENNKDRKCKLTQHWEWIGRTSLDPPSWRPMEREDTCPRQQDEETSAAGTCAGSDADCPVGDPCEKTQKWRCTGTDPQQPWERGEVTKDTCQDEMKKRKDKKKC